MLTGDWLLLSSCNSVLPLSIGHLKKLSLNLTTAGNSNNQTFVCLKSLFKKKFCWVVHPFFGRSTIVIFLTLCICTRDLTMDRVKIRFSMNFGFVLNCFEKYTKINNLRKKSFLSKMMIYRNEIPQRKRRLLSNCYATMLFRSVWVAASVTEASANENLNFERARI